MRCRRIRPGIVERLEASSGLGVTTEQSGGLCVRRSSLIPLGFRLVANAFANQGVRGGYHFVVVFRSAKC
jgi:hypothetical protein